MNAEEAAKHISGFCDETGENELCQEDYEAMVKAIIDELHELAVTRRALELACADIIYWYECEGCTCPKDTNQFDCSIEMKDRTLEGCRACGKEYLSQLFIQQAREAVNDND